MLARSCPVFDWRKWEQGLGRGRKHQAYKYNTLGIIDFGDMTELHRGG